MPAERRGIEPSRAQRHLERVIGPFRLLGADFSPYHGKLRLEF
jgi:hypothetical protein